MQPTHIKTGCALDYSVTSFSLEMALLLNAIKFIEDLNTTVVNLYNICVADKVAVWFTMLPPGEWDVYYIELHLQAALSYNN